MSKDLTLGQKIVQFLPGDMGKMMRMGNNAFIAATDSYQQKQDEAAASTEKLNKAIQDQGEQLKKVYEAYRDYNLIDEGSLTSTSGDNATVIAMSNMSPMKGKDSRLNTKGMRENDMGTTAFKAQWEENYNALVEAAQKAGSQVQQANEIIAQSITDLAVGFGQSLGNMMAGEKKFDLSFIIDAFANMAISLGKLSIASGIAGIAIKKLINNPYAAVAAGVMLVAIGTAAKAAASNIVSGNTTSSSYSTPSVANSQGGDYLSRNVGEGYFKVEVALALRNDHLAVASARGTRQMNRY
jgi:hypothetical protein